MSISGHERLRLDASGQFHEHARLAVYPHNLRVINDGTEGHSLHDQGRVHGDEVGLQSEAEHTASGVGRGVEHASLHGLVHTVLVSPACDTERLQMVERGSTMEKTGQEVETQA